MDPAIVKILGDIHDDKAATYFASQVVEICGRENVSFWTKDDEEAAVWKSVVMDLNKDLRRTSPDAELTDDEKKSSARYARRCRRNVIPYRRIKRLRPNPKAPRLAPTLVPA